MTRRLKLKGNMMKIMRAVKAAQELVNCCTLVPTEFPSPRIGNPRSWAPSRRY